MIGLTLWGEEVVDPSALAAEPGTAQVGVSDWIRQLEAHLLDPELIILCCKSLQRRILCWESHLDTVGSLLFAMHTAGS